MKSHFLLKRFAIMFCFLMVGVPNLRAEETATQAAARSGRAHKRFQAISEQATQNKWNLVFIGDSITEGWLGAGKNVWQEFYADRSAGNLGVSGDQTQHVLYRIENGNLASQSPKLAVVMIGTNNLHQDRFQPAATIE